MRPINSAHLSDLEDKHRVALLSGGLLLAFVNQKQELHAAFYDASRDRLMAKGVTRIWSLGSAGDATVGH